MNNLLLWTLAVIGLWNTINLAGRIYYKAETKTYLWSIFIGMWASAILWQSWIK